MALFRRTRSSFAEVEAVPQDSPMADKVSVGEILLRTRQSLHLELRDVSTALKIKPDYLLAIEQGRLQELPGRAYALGFVRSYSDFLGLDSAELVRRFKAETAEFATKPDLTFPIPLERRNLPSGSLLVGLILAVCSYGLWYHFSTSSRVVPNRVSLVPEELAPSRLTPEATRGSTAPAADSTADLATGAAAGPVVPRADTGTPTAAPTAQPGPTAGRTPPPADAAGSGSAVPAEVTAPLPAASSSSPAAPAPTGIAAASSPTTAAAAAQPSTANTAQSPPATTSATETRSAAAAPPAVTAGDLAAGQPVGGARVLGAPSETARIALKAKEDSWVQVRAPDHKVLFSGLLKPGDTYFVPNLPGLTMRAGNAGGLDVTVDGKPVPTLGPSGAVRTVALDPASLTGSPPPRN